MLHLFHAVSLVLCAFSIYRNRKIAAEAAHVPAVIPALQFETVKNTAPSPSDLPTSCLHPA